MHSHRRIKKDSRLWYVLHTKSRFENVVYNGLTGKSVEVFLPKIRVPSKRRDRKQIISTPLFPGYLFVKTNVGNPYEHLEIVKTVGAVRLIGNASGPVPVEESAVDSLKIMVQTSDRIMTGTQHREGDYVRVIRGPFEGLEGIFMQYRGNGRVIVNIDVLGQYAAVHVNAEDIENINPRRILSA